MYAESGSMFHYFESFSPDAQHFTDSCPSQKSNSCLISSISDYDIGCEGDLFKAPEPITIEQPLITLYGEDINFLENKFTYLESHKDEDFMSNLFEEYKDMLAGETSSEFPNIKTDDSINVKEILHPFGKFTKSLSYNSLISLDGTQMRPISMNFSELELKNVHGMQRVSSEGYIKPQLMSDKIQETRMQKLSRYRDKKTKRNFGRKIKEGIGGWSATDQRKVCQDRITEVLRQ